MAIRTPLKLDSTNLKEMSSTDTGNIIGRMVYLYMTDPSVALSVVANSGSLDAINDTRTQAGASTSHASSFRSAGDTPNISTVTVTYDKIKKSIKTKDTLNTSVYELSVQMTVDACECELYYHYSFKTIFL